jgi:Raf kinase inhibitor-like YbhB/YbcL family protein
VLALAVSAAALALFAVACDDDDGGDDDGAETVVATVPAEETSAGTATSNETPVATSPDPQAALDVTSAAFEDRAAIPQQYSCDGSNTSPALAWSGAPEGTQSYALIVDDPDAPGGDFVHWVAYDIPAAVTELPASVPEGDTIAAGGRQGLSGTGSIGYIGPCPPPADEAHRYQFRVYALDVETLGFAQAQAKREVLAAMEGHVLAEGLLIGTYDR